MSIQASLHHVTRYRYDRPITLGPQIVRLRPAPHCRTRVESYSLKVTPARHFVNWLQDPNGNWLARFVFPEKTGEFTITVDLLADMAVINPFDFFVEPFAESFPFAYPAEFSEELAPFLDAAPAGARLAAFVASIPRHRQSTVTFLVELNQRLAREIRYLVRMETGVLGPEETLAAGSGSCRDTAWLLVQVLRQLGFASCAPTRSPSTARPAPSTTSPTCTPGPRSTCRAPAGSGSTPPPDCCAGRATFRSRRRRILMPRRRSSAASSRRTSISRTRCGSRASPRPRA